MSADNPPHRNPPLFETRKRGRGSAFVWLAIVALLPALTGCRRTFWAPDGRQIAVEAYDGIRLFDVATGKFQMIARGQTGKSKAVSPAWAQDGKRLAFFVAEAGRVEGNGTLRLETLDLLSGKRTVVVPRVPFPWGDADGSDEEVLKGLSVAWLPAWSPDGRIAYPGTERKADGEGDGEIGSIWIVDAKGGAPRRLLPAGRSVACPSWSPDGRTLVYSALQRVKSDDSWVLESVGADGAGVRPLWSPPAGMMIQMERYWSADGRRLTLLLAPESDDSASCEVWELSVADRTARRVAQLAGSSWSASFSADLGTLCFAKNAPPDRDDPRKTATLLQAPYGQEQLLFKVASIEEEDDLSPPTLSPDGKTIAMLFAPDDAPTQLRLHYTDGRPARSLVVPR